MGIKLTKAKMGKSKILAKGSGKGNVPNVGFGKPEKPKLNKAQEKRFFKMIDEGEDDGWEGNIDWDIVKQHLADELARKDKDIKKLTKHLDNTLTNYAKLMKKIGGGK